MLWDEYSNKAAQILIDFREDRIEMDQASVLIEQLQGRADSNIEEFLINSVSEIDADINGYDEVIKVLSQYNETEFLDYINRIEGEYEPSNISERPSIVPWPPLLLVFVVLLAFVIDWLIPARHTIGAVPRGLEPVGIILIMIAVAGDIWAIITMWRARTNILPNKRANVLIRTGPFAHSRNPIYLCNTLAIFGLALALNNAWLIYAAIAFAVGARILAIRPEEAHLAARFGDDWYDYKRDVPRWIGYW